MHAHRGIFCPNSVVVARYGAFIVTYILQKTFFKHALLCYDILIGFSGTFLYFNKQKRRHAYDLEITLAVSHLFLCRMGA
ncbi:MAG: hypothetical protein ACLT4D_12710 [Blautia faecis]